MIEKKKLLWFFIISFILLGTVMFYIFKPLLNTLLLGFVFSYLVHPIYKAINKRLKKPRISSFIVCVLFIVVVTMPVLFAVNSLASEVFSISQVLTENSLSETISSIKCSSDTTTCRLINKALGVDIIDTTIDDLTLEGTTKIKSYIGSLLLQVPSLILNVFIILFMMYYLQIDGKKFLKKIYNIVPINISHKQIIVQKTKSVMGGILYGNILVGVIQGVLGGLGFFIFGIKAPILWGIIMFLLSFLPFLGTGIVWFPASVYLIINSLMSADTFGLWRGIGLLIYGSLIISTVDNFIRPKLVSTRANIHPVLVLFAVFGGIVVFNAAGIIIGPLVFGMFITILEMFEHEKDYLFSSDEESWKKTTKSKQAKSKIKKRY